MTLIMTWRGLAALALTAVAAACSDGNQKTPFTPSTRTLRPTYIMNGSTKRLNLTDEDQQKVAFKDPIRGSKDAAGQCRFNLDPNTMHPMHPTIVGEWNVETCAGLVYSFRPGAARQPPNGAKHVDTTTITLPAPGAAAGRRPAA
jgi:hypothetical protein